MTDVFNRRTFFIDAKRMNGKAFGIILLDLNDLKKINDEEGHQAGDEFGILIRKFHTSKIDGLLKNFDDLMSTTKYTMAHGYVINQPDSKFEENLEEADKNMYIHKKNIKGCIPR